MTATLDPVDTRPPDGMSAAPRPRRIPAWPAQALVWVLVIGLVAGPFVPLLYSSFRSKAIYLPGGAFTLGGYRTLFADPAYWAAVRNTLLFALGTTTLAVAGGTALAVLCHRTDLPGRRFFGVAVLAPIVIPPLGLIVGWNAVYGRSGYLTRIAANLHLPTWDLSSLPGMTVLGTVVTLPIAFLTTRASLTGADSSLEDAARNAGAGPLRVITRITIPMLRPAILDCTVALQSLERAG